MLQLLDYLPTQTSYNVNNGCFTLCEKLPIANGMIHWFQIGYMSEKKSQKILCFLSQKIRPDELAWV